MEFVDGSSLDHFTKHQRLSIHEAVMCSYQIALALGYAHEQGVIHRDVKPENILVDQHFFAKLTDFGLVRELAHVARQQQGPSLTVAGVPVGTPHFMSPEQWSNNVDHRTDLYSLGVTLFNLLTDSLPYPGDSIDEVRTRQQRGQRTSLRTLQPLADSDLAHIVHRSIELDPNQRYQRADALAQALAHWWRVHPPAAGLQHLPAQLDSKRTISSVVQGPPPTPTATQPQPRHTLLQRKTSRGDAVMPPRLSLHQPSSESNMDHRRPRPNGIKPSRNGQPSRTMQADSSYLKPVKIADGTFWVGMRKPNSVFFANPYLRVFEGQGQRHSLLVDPGSSSDLSMVRAKTTSVLGDLDKLSLIFINHQHPDVGSSSPTLLGPSAKKTVHVTSQDTWRLTVHSNLPRHPLVPTDH